MGAVYNAWRRPGLRVEGCPKRRPRHRELWAAAGRWVRDTRAAATPALVALRSEVRELREVVSPYLTEHRRPIAIGASVIAGLVLLLSLLWLATGLGGDREAPVAELPAAETPEPSGLPSSSSR